MKLVAGIITGAVAIIMVASLLVPIVNDAMDDQVTKFNNPTAEYMMLEDGDSYTASVVVEDGVFSITINGESYSNVTFDHLHISDTSQITFNVGANVKPMVSVLIDGVTTYIADCDSVTVNATNGNIDIAVVVAGVTTTYTTSYDWLVHSDKDGDYGLIRSVDNRTLYFNNVNQLYWSNVVSTIEGMKYYTLHNGEIRANGESLANVEYSGNSVLDNVTSVSMSSGNSGFSYLDGGNSTVLDWVVAPIEIIGYDDEVAPTLSLLNVIPMIVLLAIMVCVVSIFRSRY